MLSRVREILSPACSRKKPDGISKVKDQSSTQVQPEKRFRLVTSKAQPLKTSENQLKSCTKASDSGSQTTKIFRAPTRDESAHESLSRPEKETVFSDLNSLSRFQGSKPQSSSTPETDSRKVDQLQHMTWPRAGVSFARAGGIQVTNAKVFKCSYCGKCFSFAYSLKTHEKFLCEMIIAFPTVKTEFATEQEQTLRLIACPNCKKTYRHMHTFRRHYKYECGKQPQFACRYCPKAYTQKSSLKMHHSSTHCANDKHYRCDHCEKAYKNTKQLRSHFREQHMGGNCHICMKCGKIFKRNYHLKRHDAKCRLGRSEKRKLKKEEKTEKGNITGYVDVEVVETS
ncbi:unnamed protein product [Callosobruchus maculatus]|uniref:C2H2-type domain-containing protein n=1 Tax=Callosobruchus maculatus TaxID=64391 RepID=A0A653DL31_CALMS|nr:unnamed protein product [Callosobruchus maculatus]